MASKGQKFKKYSQEFIKQVMNERVAGKSSRFLSNKYKVPRGTILTWGHKLKVNGSINTQKRGRPIDDESSYKERYLILKKFQAFLNKRHLKKR